MALNTVGEAMFAALEVKENRFPYYRCHAHTMDVASAIVWPRPRLYYGQGCPNSMGEAGLREDITDVRMFPALSSSP